MSATAMLIQPYLRNELHFAYCYRVYLRWRTHRARPLAPMAKLDRAVLENIAGKYDIRVLECASNTTDLLALVSLKPEETISACTGKLKGQLSKWLREAQRLAQPVEQLSNGYFACTVGKSAREAVEQYLSRQSEHHGYAERALPPIFVEGYDLSEDDEARISAKHSVVVAQFHIVLATKRRRGVFGAQEGCAVAAEWRKLAMSLRVALLKVSFLPDHVHVALRSHPGVSPADLVVELMNAAQRVIFERSAEAVIQARLERLWQPSAYRQLRRPGQPADQQVYSQLGRQIRCLSHERETPRGKLVASRIQRCAGVATSVRLHEASSWHLEFSGAPEWPQE